jgi:LisH domain-containing protein ARMC9
VNLVAAVDDGASPLLAQFVDCFNNGNSVMFFAMWEDHFTTYNKDVAIQKLIIQCHVYFAVFPLLGYSTEVKVKESMLIFKTFLDKHGHEFCGNQVCLQYYALPYVPNPRTHPSFKEIFDPRWKEELQERLELIISKLLVKPTRSRLLELIAKPVTIS